MESGSSSARTKQLADDLQTTSLKEWNLNQQKQKRKSIHSEHTIFLGEGHQKFFPQKKKKRNLQSAKEILEVSLYLIATAIFLSVVLIVFYIVVSLKQPHKLPSRLVYKQQMIPPKQTITDQKVAQLQFREAKWNAIAKKEQFRLPQKSPQNPPSKSTAGISYEQKVKANQYKKLKILADNDPLQYQQLKYYENKYNLSLYSEKIAFCIVVPSFNNAEDNRISNNLDSIRQQNYSNYRVLFIDDASTDDTGRLADNYMERYPKFKQKVTIKHNEIQQYALTNIIYGARQFCKPDQVFMIVDGDDEMLGRQVLRLFSAMFQKTNAYFVYSNFLSSRGAIGYSREYREQTKISNNYRKSPLMASHLRAYYTALIARIQDSDLRDRFGYYFRAANDVALTIPILQMCHQKVYYLPELTYLYNSATGLNNHMTKLKEQKNNDRYVRQFKRYAPVDLNKLSDKIYDDIRPYQSKTPQDPKQPVK